jgi:DNA-binding transcriptional LysR family regulator
MDRFQELRGFVAVVDAGSFVGAADRLGLSKAALSRQIAELEARLGVRLLHRTTRRLSLTPEGERFLLRARELLAQLEEAEAEVGAGGREISGRLRINAPVSFGLQRLAPLWGEFLRQYPRVALEISLADRSVDLVEEGFDLAIRIARLESSSLVSRRLASTRMVLCASPGYLRTAEAPRVPADLVAHRVIAYSYWSARDEWRFTGPEGEIAGPSCVATTARPVSRWRWRIRAWFCSRSSSSAKRCAPDGWWSCCPSGGWASLAFTRCTPVAATCRPSCAR